MSESATLAKFGKRENLEQLRDEGLLYMNQLPFFWQMEDDELRGDPSDSVDFIDRGTRGELAIPNSDKKIQLNSWMLRAGPENPERINLFCAYAVRALAGSYPVDTKNFKFGDSVLVFNNPQQFIDRAHKALTEKCIKHDAGLIEYVSVDYKGDMGSFRKLQTFAYQSEWRIVCKDGPGDILKVEIGSINDICQIIPSDHINEFITIR